MSKQQSLDDLLLDETNYNEDLLTGVLAPYVRIGDSSGAFVPTDEFDSLEAREQVAIVLLYRKAAFELGLADSENASPKEVAEASGIKHNTVKPTVRELHEDGLVVNDDSRYSVPPYNYESLQKLIDGGSDER